MTYAPLAAGCPPGFTLISEEFEGLAPSYCSLPFLPDMEFDLWCGNLQRTIQHQDGGRAGGREGGREGERKRVGGASDGLLCRRKGGHALDDCLLEKKQ